MIITVEGTYQDGKVELAETPAGIERARVLVMFMPEEPQETRKPQVLYGMWKGKIPEEFNVEAALNEIRSEWLEELDEYGRE